MVGEKNSKLLEKTLLLEECMNAYKYAVETVQKNSPLMDEMAASCAEVCKKAAKECLTLGVMENDKIYLMCLEYVYLCEELEGNQRIRQEDMKKSV
ncbi:hypothetical protein LC065_06980 [Halobacillus litoralis]|uniref:hypothetical protein n=1 Tax=Halobacillus litoralis TaxID=45668 RepID=UPI001CFD72FD|nr:hypothetical protein [Halobacillus litoralis]WLR48907.1 hypothetical protein LC065_06980 [Halobacillus litoralis]